MVRANFQRQQSGAAFLYVMIAAAILGAGFAWAFRFASNELLAARVASEQTDARRTALYILNNMNLKDLGTTAVKPENLSRHEFTLLNKNGTTLVVPGSSPIAVRAVRTGSWRLHLGVSYKLSTDMITSDNVEAKNPDRGWRMIGGKNFSLGL